MLATFRHSPLRDWKAYIDIKTAYLKQLGLAFQLRISVFQS